MSGSAGRLVIVSGPSGVGKTTVTERLVETPGFERVITATTRPPRPDERQGIDYHFLDRAEFESGIDAGRFLEHACVHGEHLYGTPRDAVEDGLSRGLNVVLTIDVQGARQIRENAPELPTVTIFMLPPTTEELERRLRGRRSEDETLVARRLETARAELAEQEAYDYRVVNDDVDRVVRRIREIVLGEGS